MASLSPPSEVQQSGPQPYLVNPQLIYRLESLKTHNFMNIQIYAALLSCVCVTLGVLNHLASPPVRRD